MFRYVFLAAAFAVCALANPVEPEHPPVPTPRGRWFENEKHVELAGHQQLLPITQSLKVLVDNARRLFAIRDFNEGLCFLLSLGEKENHSEIKRLLKDEEGVNLVLKQFRVIMPPVPKPLIQPGYGKAVAKFCDSVPSAALKSTRN